MIKKFALCAVSFNATKNKMAASNIRSALVFVVCAVTVASLAGCSGLARRDLNDPSRSALQRDPANSAAAESVLYEWQESEGVKVGFNLAHTTSQNFSGYRVSLMISNVAGVPLTVTPKVTLLEGTRIALQPQDLYSLAGTAAALAHTSVPTAVYNAPPSSYYHTGTITSTSGERYNYSGRSTPSGGFSAGYAQGAALGAAIRAGADRDEGTEILKWATSYWLKNEYLIPPDSSVVGVLFFPAEKIGALPMKLSVDVGGKLFAFTSRPTL